MTTVLIVDDYASVRSTVRSLLKEQGIDVCGEASDGKEALEKVGELRPDIVLLDIAMPRMNGIEAAPEIHRLAPSAGIVFLTNHPVSLFDESARWSQGFVNKLDTGTDLIPTLNRLLQPYPPGVKGPLKYYWQHSVWDALTSSGASQRAKVDMARHAIAARLIGIHAVEPDEESALNEAVQALRKLAAEIAPSDTTASSPSGPAD